MNVTGVSVNGVAVTDAGSALAGCAVLLIALMRGWDGNGIARFANAESVVRSNAENDVWSAHLVVLRTVTVVALSGWLVARNVVVVALSGCSVLGNESIMVPEMNVTGVSVNGVAVLLGILLLLVALLQQHLLVVLIVVLMKG
jgi:hypothetical protein